MERQGGVMSTETQKTLYSGRGWMVHPATTDKIEQFLNYQFGDPLTPSRLMHIEHIGGRDWVVIVAPPKPSNPPTLQEVQARLYNLLADLDASNDLSRLEIKKRILKFVQFLRDDLPKGG
jgi:hypothetical protein